MTTATKQAEISLQESLKELETPKGSVLSGVQKLLRAASILGDDDIRIWCEIQLGTSKYAGPLTTHIEKLNAALTASAVLKAVESLKAGKGNAPAKKAPSKKASTKKAEAAEDKEEKVIND